MLQKLHLQFALCVNWSMLTQPCSNLEVIQQQFNQLYATVTRLSSIYLKYKLECIVIPHSQNGGDNPYMLYTEYVGLFFFL